MTITFSDTLGHAILATIVKDNTQWLGRTHMQKIPYILKTIGVPVPFSYKIHFYGPYSQEITFALDDLVADKIIIDQKRPDQEYSIFRPGNNTDLLLSKYKNELKKHEDLIAAVTKIFSQYTPEQLELFTTLHFIYSDIFNKMSRVPSKQRVIKEFLEVKKNKFKKDDVTKMYDDLVEVGFIKPSKRKRG